MLDAVLTSWWPGVDWSDPLDDDWSNMLVWTEGGFMPTWIPVRRIPSES